MERISVDSRLQSRQEAGVLLSKKLLPYKNSDAVVVGIPHGGVCVASIVAEMLSLKLEVMPCHKIRNPGDSKSNIGSVSPDDVFIHDCPFTIPQDYISHQIALLKNVIAFENKGYYGNDKPMSFLKKIVILVDDILESSDTMMACIRGIKKQSPFKVVVAVPLVTAEAARFLRAEVDDLVFLDVKASTGSASDHYVDFPKIDEAKVKEMLQASRKRFDSTKRIRHA